MRNGEIRTVNGAWSEEENAWVSETLFLTGDCWLEVTLADKGRMVIKKAEKEEGPWPKCLTTPWTGKEMRIRIYGSTKYRYIRIYLTDIPERIQIAGIKGYATSTE
jgi:hypothetical protein